MSLRIAGAALAALVSLPAWAVPITAPTVATFSPPGAAPQMDVAAAGDHNFDGLMDLALGDPSLGAGVVHMRLGGPPAGFVAPMMDIVGMTPGDQFGYSVDGVGDFNCDGAPDLVVGAPTDTTFSGGAGAVYVFFGPIAPGATPAAAANLVIIGEWPGDMAGQSVQLIPDIDFDGCSDIAIGAPGQGAGGPGAGAAYVVPSGAGFMGMTWLGAPPISKFIGAGGDALGWSIDSAGDFDGDGRPDLVTGAPRAGGGTGQAHLVWALPALVGYVGPIIPVSTTVVGITPGSAFGWSVDGGTDLDLNGTSEVMIGAPFGGMTTVGNPRGTAHITSRTILPPAPGAVLPAAAHTAWFQGPASGSQLGWDVSMVGDYNGDGRPDFAASATGMPSGGGMGTAYIRRGTGVVPPPGLIGLITMAPAPVPVTAAAGWGAVGYSLDGSRDNDGDGRPDLLVGAYRGPAGAIIGRVTVGSY